MQILWHEDAQGTSRLEQKGDSHSQHQQIQHDLHLGKINIPLSKLESRWGVLTQWEGHCYKPGTLNSSAVLLVTACTQMPSSRCVHGELSTCSSLNRGEKRGHIHPNKQIQFLYREICPGNSWGIRSILIPRDIKQQQRAWKCLPVSLLPCDARRASCYSVLPPNK